MPDAGGENDQVSPRENYGTLLSLGFLYIYEYFKMSRI